MTMRWPEPDFLPRRKRQPWPAWALLGTGAAVLLTAALEAREAWHQRDAAQQALARAGTMARGPKKLAAAARPEDDAAKAAAALQRRLAHPWAQVLADVETASGGVQWLALEHAADRPELRLEGQAADASAAGQVVQSLSRQVGWRDVVLTRLQRGNAPGAETAERFEIAAQRAAAGNGS